jgi:hypothetical protein
MLMAFVALNVLQKFVGIQQKPPRKEHGTGGYMIRLINADELMKKQITMTQYDEGGWDMEVRAVTVEDIENAPAINSEDLRPRGR